MTQKGFTAFTVSVLVLFFSTLGTLNCGGGGGGTLFT